VHVYKLVKIFAIRVSVQKVLVAWLPKPPKKEFTIRKWGFWR